MSSVLDSSLLQEIHSHSLDSAINHMLVAFVKLMESENGKFLFMNETNQGTRVYRYNGSPLNSIEKELVKKSLASSEARYFLPGQYIFDDEENELGVLDTSYLTCPFGANGKKIGAILLGNKRNGNYFDENDINLAESFSATFSSTLEAVSDSPGEELSIQASMQTVIENLYLLKENFDANAQLAEMVKVSKMINSTLNLQSLLETIMESGKIVLKSESASLMLLDPETDELYFNVISTEADKGLSEIRIPKGQGIAGLVASTGKSEIVNDAQNDPRIFKKADETIQFVTRNLIAVPLLVRGNVIGVLEVLNSIGRDNYTKKDLQLFTTFSEQAALAIHNRELIDSLRSANAALSKKVIDLSNLNQIGQNLLAAQDIDELFEGSMDLLSEIFQVSDLSVYLPDPDAEKLVIHASRSNQMPEVIDISSDSIVSACFLQNRMIYTNNLAEPENQRYQASSPYVNGTSILYPFSIAESCLGVLCLLNKQDNAEFEPAETLLLNTLSNQMVTAISNIRLTEEQIEKQAYEREIDITSSIQKSILPTIDIKDERFQVGVLSKPAKITGGDFFDYWESPQDDQRLLIADVSGKSLPAALFMAASSSILRTMGQLWLPIEETLSKANDLIYKDSRSGMFVTVFLANYKPNTGALQFATAGHNEQIHFQKDSKAIQYLGAKGSPLGVVSSDIAPGYEVKTIQLETGDILVLYTDGIVEAINTKEEQFGHERFEDYIRKNHDLHPQDMAEQLYATVSAFAGEQPQYDDFTLVILKRNK